MFESQYANPSVSLSWRVALLAVDRHGHDLERGELRRALDPHDLIRSAEISRAIGEAKRRRLIGPESSAGRLFSLLLSEDESATGGDAA